MSSKVAQESTPPATQQASAPPPSLRATIFGYLRGNLGPLPVVLTLVIIAVFFQVRSEGIFLSPRNLNFLTLQIASLGTIGLASTLVLLIGEIDLSLGVISYLTGAVTVIYSVYHGWPTIPALLIGLAVGAVIGLVNGIFVAILRVPSFVVTLAGLLAYQGVVIHILFPQTSLNVSDDNINNLATSYLPDVVGIGLPVLAVLIYAAGTLSARLQRQRRGLAVGPIWATWLRIGVALGLVIGTISLFENYQGVPQAALILIGLVLLFWLILRFTAFGRHVYAVGGNAEAARRAGINVTRTRIFIFILASVLGAAGGLLAVSRAGVATAQVNPTLLLNAIATAVIGGVSLFGGRGSVWGVVLGGLVIGSIENGLALLQQNPDVYYMVEGGVLIIAVTADALARRGGSISVTAWIGFLRRVLRLAR
jgi:D-xylose transport system permease protein